MSQRETLISNFIWGKKKEKINVDLDLEIRQNLVFQHQENAYKCLTEIYHVIFSTKNLLNECNELVTKCRHENKFYLANYKDIHHNYLSKTFFLKRLENIFEVNSITLLKVFHNTAYRLRITI